MTVYAENILVCIAIPLLIALLFVRDSARRFVCSFLVGMGVCLLSAYISGYLSLISGYSADDTAVYLSPVVEELMKGLPGLLYLFLFMEKEDKLFAVAIGIGAGFATFENCCYILSAGAGSLPYIMIRGMAVGVMHIVSILALAMGFSVARHFHAMTAASVIGALSLSMTFHALYNLLVSGKGAFSVAGYLLPVLAALLLYAPYKKLRALVSEEDGADPV